MSMDLSRSKLATGAIAILLLHLILQQPRWLLRLIRLATPSATYAVDTEENVIALTIDDGLQTDTTEQILQVLERHQTSATFFVLSNSLKNQEDLARRLIAAGHELGHHMTRDEASIGLASDEFALKFDIAHRAISRYDTSRWFRPGMGWYRPSMVDHAKDRGYCLVLGSLFPYDTHLPFVGFSHWFILHNLDPGDILVLHDGPKGRGVRTAVLLDRLLPAIKARGYRVVSLEAAVSQTAECP